MNYTNLVPVIGTVLRIMSERDCCSHMMSLQTANGIVNFRINSETVVIDSRQLRVGMQIAAFYDSTLPVPLIDNNLVSTDGALQLNVARNTTITTLNGQNFNCNLGNRNLLVYYTVTTRSIPPQTTPRKIVVLC